MKKIILFALAVVMLSGCSTLTLTKVESQYGRPARVEIECIPGAVCDENTYYNNKDAVKYIYWFYYQKTSSVLQPWDIQEWCFEYKADKNGKVINYAEYIEQQSRLQSGRTPIQGRSGKLPGIE
ncbi:MAG: membrane lipoprotein lipid attachment site-containing protein [Thermodesulfobacteriota bacterium]